MRKCSVNLGFSRVQLKKTTQSSLSRLYRVLMGLQVLRVWLDLVVLLVCLVSVEREASLVSLDLL